MKSRQSGFTMIELIVVIVILGILAATAIPKFLDMRAEAQQAAVNGVAGAAASAMSLNFAGCQLTNQTAGAKCTLSVTCATVGSIMQGGVMPANYAGSGLSPSCTMTASGTAGTVTAPFLGM